MKRLTNRPAPPPFRAFSSCGTPRLSISVPVAPSIKIRSPFAIRSINRSYPPTFNSPVAACYWAGTITEVGSV
jgi:hypothetical protein